MKSSIFLSLVFFAFSFFAFSSPAQAQNNVRYLNPVNAWVVNEGFDDYKLLFFVPSSKQWRVEGTTIGARAVLRTVAGQNGGIINYDPGSGQRVVVVTAGGWARYSNGYFGSLNTWRNSVRVAYW